MPAAIIAIAASYGATALGANAFLAAAASTFAGFLVSSVMARKAQRKAIEKAKDAFTDRTIAIRSATKERSILLGTDRVADVIWPWFTWGDIGQYHTFGVILGGHRFAAINTVYFKNEAVTLDGSGWVTAPAKYTRVKRVVTSQSVAFVGGDATLAQTPVENPAVITDGIDGDGNPLQTYTAATYSGTTVTAAVLDGTYTVNYVYETNEPLFRIWKYTGAPGQAASAELIAAADEAGVAASWDSTRVGNGIPYLVVQMEADFNVLGQIGLPEISAECDGAVCYDPRTATSAHTYNPALQARWLMRECPYVPVMAAAEVNDDYIEDSANNCDELVAFSATDNLPRYESSGKLSTAMPPMQMLAHVLAAMAGDAFWSGGQMLVLSGMHREPTLTIDESMLSGEPLRLKTELNNDEVYNRVTGEYTGPETDYVRTSYPDVAPAAYLAQDGGEDRPREPAFDLELVNDARRCQMLAWIELTRHRQPVHVQLGTNLSAYDTLPRHPINLSLARYGYTPKVFDVDMRRFNGATLSFALHETGADVWDWDYADGQATVDLPDTSLPDASSVGVLTGVTTDVSETAVRELPRGELESGIDITWPQVEDTYVVNGGQIVWQYRSAFNPDAEWLNAPRVEGHETFARIAPVVDGVAYQLQGFCINNVGRQGLAIGFSVVVVGKASPPDDATDAVATAKVGAIHIEFTLPGNIDIGRYEIERSDDGSTGWTVVHADDAQGMRNGVITWDDIQASGTLKYYRVRVFDTSDNASGYTAVVSATAAKVPLAALAPDVIAVTAALQAAQESSKRTLELGLHSLGQTALGALLQIDTHSQQMRDAGITIDPATGTVRLYALDYAIERWNDVGILIDAVNASINLKASTTYVDNAIAAALLDPDALLVFDALELRISEAEVDIDGLEADILLKATQVEVDDHEARITTAEADISAAEAEILLRVTQVDFDALAADVSDAESRLTIVEDGAEAVTALTAATYRQTRNQHELAQTTLGDLINGDATKTLVLAQLATARSELHVKVNENFASATASTELLAARLDTGDFAAVKAQSSATASTAGVLATSVSAIEVRLNSGDYASVKTSAEASADTLGNITASWVLEVDVGGVAIGMRAISDGTTASLQIDGDVIVNGTLTTDKLEVNAATVRTAAHEPTDEYIDTVLNGDLSNTGGYAYYGPVRVLEGLESTGQAVTFHCNVEVKATCPNTFTAAAIKLELFIDGVTTGVSRMTYTAMQPGKAGKYVAGGQVSAIAYLDGVDAPAAGDHDYGYQVTVTFFDATNNTPSGNPFGHATGVNCSALAYSGNGLMVENKV